MVTLQALGAVAALLLPMAAGTASQADFPACAVNNHPEYYCCQISEVDSYIFTKYYRPDGEAYAKEYEEGWAKSRQINWVPTTQHLSKYKPDSPEYVYGEADKTCRMHFVVVDGAIVETQQCTFEPASGDDRFTYNATLAEDSSDASVYWTFKPNPSNNNASFPIGATCRSLMLPDGSVNSTDQALCTASSFTAVYRFTTFKEAPLVAIYVVYALCIGLLGLWVAYRSANSRSSASVPLVSIEDGSKKLLDNRGGPETPGVKSINGPSLAMRASEVKLRNSVEDIEQVGYTPSAIGQIVFAYFILMTVFLNVLVILVDIDNNGKFADDKYAGWFNSNDVIIKVYIVIWVVTSVWFGAVVVLRDSLINYFRVPDSLDRCQFVRMYKPEKMEVLLADRTGVSSLVAKVEAFLFPNARQGFEKTVPVQSATDGARFVEFQHLRYTFDEVEGKFIPGSVVMGDTYDAILAESTGLTTAEHTRRQDIVGFNAIEVEMPSWGKSTVEEFFSFFYIYQLMCYYVWYFTAYIWVSVLNTVVIVVSASVNIWAKRTMLSQIVTMTHYRSDVEVKRDGVWKTVPSSDLVPGDLVRVAENWVLPCDLVVVKGATVCDESMLTGESMPVQKFPIPEDSHDVYVADGSGKKYTLFSGTKVLASGREEDILAVVQSTGAHTNRGQLVQSILFPAPIRFKYDEHLKAVFAVLFVLGFVAAYFAMKFLIENAGLTNSLFAFVYGMFMFSAVLNPLLPVVITIGQTNASKRLLKKGVNCLNPHRIILCGKVRVFCFDKTGTITKEGLDFRGCVPVNTDTVSFLPEVTDVATAPLNPLMKYALASCHAVGSMKDDLVGMEVEVKMFKATQWKLFESEGQQPIVRSVDGSDELEVVKRFEFDHHRMSMSVVMKHKSTGKIYVFTKGSYEKMQSVSAASSVPANYTETAENLAKNGCYVLGMAFKEVQDVAENDMVAFLANRDAVEEGLSLLGLVMFRNELKEDSRDALLTLKKGDVRTVMITGDNAMTGCFIARASGMVDAKAQVVLGDMVADEATGSTLVWKDIDSQTVYSADQIRELVKDVNTNVELAVTGKAFDFLHKMGEIQSLLLKIRIFSRMTPSGKVECVRLHMASGAVTGMCGDGGNDCGALRIAHVGVALSDAEASVVSPFTSKLKSLESVVDVVLEGRGALATSFGNVKYLIMYGLIGIGCRFVMYSNSVFISQFGFMYLDGAILVGISYGITRSRPLKKLGTARPTSSLVGATTLCSMIGSSIIHWIFLYIGTQHVVTRPWYCPFNPANINLVQWWHLQDTNLGCCLWYLICFQQLSTGITTSLGSKFRLPVWRNYFLVFIYLFLFIWAAVMFVGPPNRLTDQFRISTSTNVMVLPDIPLPQSFRWEIFGIGCANTVVVVLYEYLVILGPVRNMLRARFHKDVLPMKL